MTAHKTIAHRLMKGVLASALLSISAATASATTLTDGDFGGLGVDTTHVANFGVVTSATTPCSACGVGGGAGLQVQVSNPQGGGATWALIDNNLSYNPSTQGAITSLSMSADKFTSFSSTPIDLNTNNGLRVTIKQDGNIYQAIILGSSVNIPAGGGTIPYTTLTGGLLARDFFVIFNSGNPALTQPDFAGNPMLFGVAVATGFAAGTSVEVDFDNIAVGINVAQTPLPTALPLFATGLGALALLGWRRKSKAQAAA